MSEEIKIVIDNKEYTGWKSFDISRSLDSMCGSFSAQIFEDIGDLINGITPGKQCDVFIGDTQLISGFIFERSRSVSESSSSVSISGRDKTADLIDCSAIKRGGEFTNIDLFNLVSAICEPFKINVISSVGNHEKFKKFVIENGESAYEAIERACRQRGVIAITDRAGNLKLSSVSKSLLVDSWDSLIYGENIKSIDESYSHSDRYSQYIVKSQDSGDGNPWDDAIIQKIGTANDSIIKRYRPLLIINEAKGSSKTVKARASWEAQIRAGRSLSYDVSVVGFRQKSLGSNQPLWEIGEKVNLIHDQWGINESKLIRDITCSFSDSGSITKMNLVNPNTYSASPDGEVSFS
jgi:prophage tail gpP-like protein